MPDEITGVDAGQFIQAIVGTPKPQELSLAQRVQQALNSHDPAVIAEVHNELATETEKLTRMEKMVKAVMKAAIHARGEIVSAAGSKRLQVGQWILRLKAQVGAERLDDKKVEAKLRAKGIDLQRGMNMDIRYVADPDKIRALQMSGTLTTQDLKECYADQTWALQKPTKVEEEVADE